MADWLAILLEIIKIAFPALVVAFATYYVIREFLQNQARRDYQQLSVNRQQTTLPLRLQAYERLSLFCERIAIAGLLLRVRRDDMSANGLRLSLLMAIQQEFEHNITQQIYVSDQLWQIVKAARDDLSEFINVVFERMDGDASGRDYAAALLNYYQQRESDPLLMAQSAIRKETATLF